MKKICPGCGRERDVEKDFAWKNGYEESRVDFVLKAEQSKSLTEGFRG